MKSLEEVIKYKLNFLPKGTEPFYAIQTYTAGRALGLRPVSDYELYEVKERIFSNDSFSLMEDITPLFIYISSCEKYYRENGHGEIYQIIMHLIRVDGRTLSFGSSIALNDTPYIGDIGEHKISIFKKDKNDSVEWEGYYERYTKPFKIWFQGLFMHFPTEEELQSEAEAQEDYFVEQVYYAPVGTFIGENDNESKEEDTREEFPINNFKTFKSDQCIICLEEEPKGLFCNCGHICICEKCATHRYDNCPVCKKENTILRLIE